MAGVASVLLVIVKVGVFLWDIITWPVYQALQRPWERRKAMVKTRSRPIRRTDDEIVFESPEKSNPIHDDLVRAKCSTLDSTWTWAVSRYGSRELLGTRDILAEEDEVQANGKVFKKFHLGDYRWLSYEDADSTAEHLGRGLRALGMQPKERICIFADTRAEWYLTAIACFKQAFPLVTIYTNLGEEAVVHGVLQTEVSLIVTSHELLPKFRAILKNTPAVKNIVYFEDQIHSTDTANFPSSVNITPFWDVISLGKKHFFNPEYTAVPPSPSDLAIIMYTSGSTGVPKGVMLSHRNLFSTFKSFMLTLDLEAMPGDTYIAFLPLAHVLELICETMLSMYGVRIGYSTPNTLSDRSSMIKKGSAGDASVLRPTIMAAVPLILDRVYKTITDTLKRRGPGFENFFNFCFEYRLAAARRGETTPVLDFLVFRSLRSLFGGRLRLMITGGAPLSKESHDFIRTCMGCPVLQGYGLTETTACATITEISEMSTEAVGPPNQGMQIKLINWDEGNYRVTDQPNPRGEVVIGGNAVAEGYYLMPDKTLEDFYDAQGRRWFKTGDIGLFQDDGTLKIIDRKKDLVKLQFGEYVSLGKVESCLKTCRFIENVCVYGDSFKSYCVALVCPERAAIVELASKYGKADLTFEELCEDRDVTGTVLRELINHGKATHLEKFEIPAAITLCLEQWTPDSGLVTAAFKLKRKPIQEFYQRDLDRMYGVSRGG